MARLAGLPKGPLADRKGDAIVREEDRNDNEDDGGDGGGGGGEGLVSLNDDLIAYIFSFLTAKDLSAAARVNRRLRALCNDDRKVWRALCERRWGQSTCLGKWGGGLVTFRAIYSALHKLEGLVGMWRSVGNCQFSSIVDFEWRTDGIEGVRVVPYPGPDSYQIVRVPFIKATLTTEGEVMIQVNLQWSASLGRGTAASSPESPSRVRHPIQELQGSSALVEMRAGAGGDASSPPRSNRLSVGEDGPSSPSEEILENSPLGWGVDDVADANGVGWSSAVAQLATLDFVSDCHFILEEKLTPSPVPTQKPCSVFAEAAVLASVCVRGSPDAHYDSQSSSPPGSFGYAMCQYMSNKVTSPGGGKCGRRQRRQRRRLSGLPGFAEHFVKVTNTHPTTEKPLQGLWRSASGPTGGQNLLLLSYDDEERQIVCRKLAGLDGVSKNGTVQWRAKICSCMASPLSPKEQLLHDRRLVVPAPSVSISSFYYSWSSALPPSERTVPNSHPEQVVPSCCENMPAKDINGGTRRQLSASSSNSIRELVVEESVVVAVFHTVQDDNLGTSREVEGRLWQYAGGHLAYSLMEDEYMVEYRRVIPASFMSLRGSRRIGSAVLRSRC
ncbi:hypothetical protein CBR_g25752 [Chara braunii]|uniref:F-box domain-containing protein n=1 Tax=Chara braunii TaxID=69332 RepID=A0A388L686_CHABU|nr:hypothetical protein CBR_g25752 [Chara braunii]|eukprot:GBG77821.1 hypothetical protein CBR_g25752 [Chara braunii]